MTLEFAKIQLLLLDIDGTLTDAKVSWGGIDVGWTQTFSVRDGEAIRRLVARGVGVVPLSRNQTECARVRMEGLDLATTWVGVSDKMVAFEALRAEYGVPVENIAYVGDGAEDVPLLRAVGLGCSVADGHPTARVAARFVTEARGGQHAIEELVERIFEARGWAP
jgi:3-deoxy-D-manno-octulosonate 8-phosphate phosphatase (KDO 8-P phosphatase)